MTVAQWRARAVIDHAAFAHNLERARALAPNSAVMAVVKANAYGHGVETLKPALEQADQLAVIDIAEAQTLRQLGLQQSITLLQGVNSAAELQLCQTQQFIPAICNPSQLALLVNLATEQGFEAAPAFCLKLDTGMHRLGLNQAELADALAALKQAGLSGPYRCMSHFACADDSAEFTQQQIQQFDALIEGLPLASQSLANSAAIVDYPDSHRDLVRPGIMLYGATPFPDRDAAALDLKPVMSLQAKVAAVRALSAGEAVGYGLTWQAENDCQVLVLSAGYGDGVPRNLPAGLPVAVREHTAKTVARVSMDSCFAVLPSDADVAVGDIATLWGQQLPVDTVAKACGTIGYELLTRVTARVPRVVL